MLGDRGYALVAANMSGDGWRIAHDAVKHHCCLLVEDHFGRARTEVHGLFADLFDGMREGAGEAWREVNDRVRKGAVPDVGAAMEGEAEQLYEIKGIYPCRSRYPFCLRGGRERVAGACGCSKCLGRGVSAVNVRGALVPREVMRSLAKLEVKLGMTASVAEVGPLQQRLTGLGGVRELVFGSFGGVSEGFHRFIGRLAKKAAPLMWHDMLSPSIGHCAGVLKTQMQRSLCFVLARAKSQLIHSRLAILRGGNPRAGFEWDMRQEQRERGGRWSGAKSGSDADWDFYTH